jgi:hypothetical protein
MEEIISKEIVRKLMDLNGESRGIAIKDDFEYVFQRKGVEGVKMLENELESFGCPIKYEDIKTMQFYPVGLEAVIMLATKKLFNYDKEDFKKLGEFSSKLSFIIRIFIKYFGSLETIARESPKMWRKYHTVGDPTVLEFSEEKRYAILRVENFDLVPIYCQMLTGYFSSLLQMVVKGSVVCKETKCTFKGDDYHEFLLKW